MSVAERLRAIAQALVVAQTPPPLPEPEPPPPPDTRPEDESYLVPDDHPIAGVTYKKFSECGNLQWRIPGGTWIGADGAQQSEVPFSTAVPKNSQWLSLDLLPFMTRWATLNDGVFLRTINSVGSANYHSREYQADPTLRPHMIVTTEQGEFICPCVCDVMMSSTKSSGTGDSERVSLNCGMMRFDISGVVGTPTAAVAKLYCTKSYGGTLGSFLIDAPRVYDYGVSPVTGGIVDEVESFADLAAHPDVLYAFEQSPAGWAENYAHYPRHQSDIIGGVRSDVYGEFEHVAGPHGLTWVRFRYPTNDLPTRHGSGSGFRSRVDMVPVPKRGEPWPQGPTTHAPMGPTELHVAYGVMAEDDFAGITDLWHNGGKLPGLTGMYGTPAGLDSGRYWDNWVEGQTPGVGKWLFEGDEIGSAAKDLWAGWGARIGWHSRVLGAIKNAMRKCVALSTYFYWPMYLLPGSGQAISFERAQLHPMRHHTIEQRIKMNTVDNTVRDAGGNGVGRPDGVIQVWLDGILVYDRHDVIWTHHIGIAIQDFWATFYNGGTQAGNDIHHQRFGPVIIAKRYIGHRFTSD